MHKLESFALSSGSKIHKPYVYKSYYPILEKDFICISKQSDSNSRSYDFFNDVLFHIMPYLKDNEIEVLEILENNSTPLFYVKPYSSLNRSQSNYLISKSKLYFGNLNFNAYISSALSIPCVTPVNNSFVELEAPYWSDESFSILMHNSKDKPSFDDNEHPKTINDVYPEKVAAKILDHLNIDHELNNIETVFVGPEYHHQCMDVVPGDYVINGMNLPEGFNIRMDKNYDLDFLLQAKNFKNFNIITNKSIPEEVLKSVSNGVHGISYFINKNTSIEDIKSIESIGKPIKLLTSDYKNLSKIRLKFIDYPVSRFGHLDKKSLNEGDYSNLKFLSKRNIMKNGSVYNSYTSLQSEMNTSTVRDCKEFLEDLPFCRVYKEIS